MKLDSGSSILVAVAMALAACLAAPLGAQNANPARVAWNRPQAPFRIYGNTYWVGPAGLGSILITSDSGHVLIDGALPESVDAITASIRSLGFRVEDVKLILNSHAHYDHAGGIAALQRASGATVAATSWSARTMEAGATLPDDPQYGLADPYPKVAHVQVIADGDSLRVGPLVLTAHLTAGHTPGGTSWSWRSCEGDRCLDLVYADSQTPVSRDGYLYSRTDLPRQFERGFATLDRLSCDILITPHPSASHLFERIAARDGGTGPALVDHGCHRYAEAGRRALATRLEREAKEGR